MSAGELSRNGSEIETKSQPIIFLGDFIFDPELLGLSDASGAPVDLRSQSLAVLCLLAAQAGRVVSKDNLIDSVWGDTFVTDDSLVQCISDIRRAICDRDHKVIQTLPRRGYRLNSGRATPHLPALALPDLAGRRAIAVLPFTNLNDNQEQTFFAEGISEDLIARLSMVRTLTVLAVPSRYTFGGEFIRAENADTEFEPEFLIKGTVRRAGDKVRVTVQLLDNSNGAIVLSRRYDRRVYDIFEIQDDLVGEIIAETQVALTDGEVAHLAVRQTRSVQAWEYFHQGLLEHIKYRPESFQTARRMYRRALDIDPDYFDAMVADAWALWMEARSLIDASQIDALRECRVLVDALISRWPNRPDALHLDAVLLMMEGEHEAAEKRADQGRKAGRSYLWGYAIVHIYGGSVKKATELFAELINSSLVLNNDALYCYAQCLTLMGEYEQAIILAEEYRLRVPATVYGYTLLATAQGMAGQSKLAAETVAAMRQTHPRFTLAMFRQHEPYRDAEILKRITDLLRKAGIPD
ncbi:winged helix-turn-helix domain-containing protein [uncultured Ruegeria sp.]|uniref:winged helix-turn-helix domain-containing protein n=1 Tax=uncultured Ruegeria sp. TaxID=259304 RepID=UPI00260B39E8|nr:winged helix-turn-helix domain-containing protein [uncultured Ruegeria sp.]